MKVRALKNCQTKDENGRVTYRRGPEYDIYDKLLEGGEEFWIADDAVINLDVLEIVEPPAGGKKPKTMTTRQATAAVEKANEKADAAAAAAGA